jgi:molecular chaperone HscB
MRRFDKLLPRTLRPALKSMHASARQTLDHLEPVDPSKSYFDVFGLSRSYSLSLPQLKRSFLDLQRRVHPDAYAQAGDEQAGRAKRWSETVNRAYKTLLSPLERAEYLVCHPSL